MWSRLGRSALAMLWTLTGASAQTFFASASAATPMRCNAHLGASATVPAGAALPNGFTVIDTGSGSATARVDVALGVNLLQPSVTYRISDRTTPGFSPTGPLPGLVLTSSTGPHDTVLAVSSSQPAAVAITIRWTHALRDSGVGATVDVGDDGSIEWLGFWDLAPRDATLMANIGTAPLHIRTHTLSRMSTDSYTQQQVGPGDSSLTIEVALRTAGLQVVGGNLQSAPAGEAFAQPVVFAVTDVAGNPVAGQAVTIAVGGPGGTTIASPLFTDAQGMVTVPVQATAWLPPQAGLVEVTATTPGIVQPVHAVLFVDSLQVGITPPSSALLFASNPAPNLGPVPYVILASAPGITPLQTPFGPVATNPLDPSTFVLEDSIGVFGFAGVGGQGAIGRPGVAQFYQFPTGFLSGTTLQLQAVGIDPLRGVVRTNPAALTFP